LYRLGAPRYRDRLMQGWARAGRDADPTLWQSLVTLPQRWQPPTFPLKAADFITRGIAEGPALGHVLTIAEDAWLAADFPLDSAQLAAIADQTVARFRRDHRL
ncbi:MAG: CCA tRNA nucleotidyltransferase, partial [Nitrobacter sp.]